VTKLCEIIHSILANQLTAETDRSFIVQQLRQKFHLTHICLDD